LPPRSAARGARSPHSRITTTWARRTEFVVHHSDGSTTQSVRSIQNFHLDDPAHRWSDIRCRRDRSPAAQGPTGKIFVDRIPDPLDVPTNCVYDQSNSPSASFGSTSPLSHSGMYLHRAA
jgi:hypothetical protein